MVKVHHAKLCHRYVLRISNNGNKSEAVRWEHAVLSALAGLPPNTMDFQIPTAMRSLHGGLPHVQLSSGAESCVWHVIPGALAGDHNSTRPKVLGLATGQLVGALAQVGECMWVRL